MRRIRLCVVLDLALIVTLLIGVALASSRVFADNDSVVDEINITVPVSCTMSGTGMTSHNATINNGLYENNIGSTILHAFCNDSEGFAIYAAGYTGDEIGGINSNKLVGTSASDNATIETGLATTAGNPDVSNWAMKLTVTQDSGDTTGTNAFIIDSAPNASGGADASFAQYHVVPNDYTKVAHKNSGTDMAAVTGGAKLTTTYAAYISKTQPADTYSGQVKYTLVHPSTIAPVLPDQVGVLFHSNDQPFSNGRMTNRVVYGESYRSTYIATTPDIVETSNLTDGVQNGGYTNDEYVFTTKTYDGAVRVKVEVDYGITERSASIYVFGEAWDEDWNNWQRNWFNDGWSANSNTLGTKTYMVDGDTVTVFAESWNTPVSGYDYGFYVRIYPIYAVEREDTTPLSTEYYVGDAPTILKTSNIADGGIQNGAYTDDEYILETVTMDGAAKIKVEVDYGITSNSTEMIAFGGVWDGDWDNWQDDWDNYGWISSGSSSGTKTYTIDGDTVTIFAESWDAPESGYDYGYYIRIYPLYEIEQENTMPDNLVNAFGAQIGNYVETTSFSGHWYMESDNGRVFFENESDVVNYLEQNMGSLGGTTIDLYAFVAEGLVMQNAAEWKDGLSLEQQVEAMDARDGKKYTVAKLADGRVWMTQNLDLDLDSDTIYTNLDTDLGWNSTTHSYDTASWAPMRSTYETSSNHIHEWCKGGTYFNEDGECVTNFTPESYDPGDLYWNGTIGGWSDWSSPYCTYVTATPSCFDTLNTIISTYTTAAGVSTPQYHLGNYYNWAAAVASNDVSVYEGPSPEVHQSICPAGWTLPYVNKPNAWEEQGEFIDLVTRYGWDSNSGSHSASFHPLSSPLYFVLGGYFIGNFNFLGAEGDYWSSSSYSNHFYDMGDTIESTGIGRGISVRCILRDDL